MVAKETEPVEERKVAGLVDGNVSDTGAEKVASLDRVESLDEKDRGKFSAARTSIGKD
ncbi:hypothetical protein IMZ48_01925 [Candidatus Bathyarchaeota archaeon]|nr:hypothetical protein [Candidatus Bathyarchaeota archaeon]